MLKSNTCTFFFLFFLVLYILHNSFQHLPQQPKGNIVALLDVLLYCFFNMTAVRFQQQLETTASSTQAITFVVLLLNRQVEGLLKLATEF